jgi:hypothetical protein
MAERKKRGKGIYKMDEHGKSSNVHIHSPRRWQSSNCYPVDMEIPSVLEGKKAKESLVLFYPVNGDNVRACRMPCSPPSCFEARGCALEK